MASVDERWNEGVLKDMIKEFCDITNSGEDDAKRMILANNFILQDAVNALYEKGGTGKMMPADEIAEKTGASKTSPSSNTFKLLTWNIEGLSQKNFNSRTLAVAAQINTLNPHAVYLQEVIDSSLEIIRDHCKGYTIHHHKKAFYYCAIMIRNTPSVQFVSKDVVDFPQSRMGRCLLRVNVLYDERPVSLLTTHLESTQQCKQERTKQLACCFHEMVTVDNKTSVILAGDLNLRDDEVEAVGGLKKGIKDSWIESGSESETKYTWDMHLNDNIALPEEKKRKCRFDRVYYRSSGNGKMLSKKFDLIGRERLPSCGSFPSDHWGILCEFSFEFS